MTNYSNSYINQFAKCPLSCRYRYDLHLQPSGDESSMHHMVYGSAAAKAFEVLYKSRNLADAKQSFADYYPTQLDETDNAKTLENGLRMLDGYVWRYKYDPDWKVVAVENKDLTEDGYTVKLDLVVEDKRTGDILGVDHKTTGNQLDYKFFSKFNPNSQVTQYIRYIKEKYGRCDGFIINAISIRWLNEKDKSGKWNGRYFDPDDASKPWSIYSHKERRYVKYYKKEMIAAWGCQINFERQMLNRTPQQIEQDQESKNYWIARIEDAKREGIWGMNTNQCFLCEYQPVCSAGWDWTNDSDLILNTFRQVCEKWIPEQEGHCNLDMGHSTPCSSAMQLAREPEFNVVV